ncbi:hypothetical protein B0T16DRAFT_458805 [Cercophora newfieldiana]|uniref:2EXR domain-containing protein n=1 Tax=Cercophora newfieldiana TaxID=92897 RepID=A0AA39Y733_9PEZI|nr:hypothetical protein B0T16DRAFT_458805 [Cercophora newfieldiana]
MAAPESTAAAQFSLFPNLPAEVRLLIWGHACCAERIIPLLPGQGHLFPRVHPTLAIPPALHACSESRQVGLKHYNLLFHPHLYINPEYDHLMLHVFYPQQVIDPALYLRPVAGFHWGAAPRRLAVLLDDISFSQSYQDSQCAAWITDPKWRQRLTPFSQEFMSLLVSLGANFEHLTLLVLPPLTARPNPTAHRFDLVDGTPELLHMSKYLTEQLRDGIRGNVVDLPWLEEAMEREGTVHDDELYRQVQIEEALATAVRVSVCHATCVSWAPDLDVSWSAPLRQRHSAAQYADMKFGNKPVREDPPPFLDFMDLPMADRGDRIRAIRKDLRALSEPFCADLGLGPHVIWEQNVATCGTSMLSCGIGYEAEKQLLWLFDHEDAVPKLERPPEFNFDDFLKETPRRPSRSSGRAFSNWVHGIIDEEQEGKDEEVEEEEVEEEADAWTMTTLRFNGLVHWE